MTDTPQAEVASVEESRLVPARADLSTNITQLIVASVVAAAAAFSIFALAPHLVIAADALILNVILPENHSLISGIMSKLTDPALINWGCGPLALASLSIDTGVLHLGESALRWGNIALHALCAILVVHITAHAARSQNRSNSLAQAAALWAGVLYAVFPTAVNWLVPLGGRAELLATTFALAAVLFYLRFRMLREQPYLTLSLVCFALSMLSGPEGLVVPPAVIAAELLLFGRDELPAARRGMFVASYLMMLSFAATITVLIPGYGPLNLAASGADRWLSLLTACPPALKVALALAVGAGAARLAQGRASFRALAWPLLWFVCALVIHMSMQAFRHCGSDPWCIVPAAPLSIFLAISFLPAVDTIKRKTARPVLIGGVAAAVVLTIWLGYVSLVNLHSM